MEGRRERKKAALRQHISDVATGLFVARGFDQVSVSEIAEAADVARPTVFAHFPRKEDLLFDQYPETEAEFVGAVLDRADGISAVRAIADRALFLASQESPPFLVRLRQEPFFRLVAESRALQARAREMAEQLEDAVAMAMEATGVRQPRLVAALTAAAYRTAHLQSVRRVLAGHDPVDHVFRVQAALRVVEQAVDNDPAFVG
ncbi:helix-turn-helix domain-containing protein [Kribbella sp. NPDC051770]|uniref:TetR/AcrR family transcriptional regulator n=1 Tax=Kribbella sp. NPDC051770 TaxID=3155413 RepID=UPI003433420F